MDHPPPDGFCGQCAKPIGTSVSRYFCSDSCQHAWYMRYAIHKAEKIAGSDSRVLAPEDHPNWLRVPGAVQPERTIPVPTLPTWAYRGTVSMPLRRAATPTRDEAA